MELLQRLELLKEACDLCGEHADASAIEHYLGNVREPVSIMIVGEGKHGKTCLLNGLLGREVARAGRMVKSANCNYYRNVQGAQSVIVCSFDEKKREEIAIDREEEILEYYDRFRNEDVNVYWNLNLVWPGGDIVLIDTEGFNQVNANSTAKVIDLGYDGAVLELSDLFDQFYVKADIVIWCVKGDQPRSTAQKFRQVKRYQKPVFLVYTYADADIDNEDLEEIETEEDFVLDMRNQLPEISEACIQDFAGFAGDVHNEERRTHFVQELRNAIIHYINGCTNGVKQDVGERLYDGIYHVLLKRLQQKNAAEYEIIEQYFLKKDELQERVESVMQELLTRLKEGLRAVSAEIDHNNYYEKMYEENGRSYIKSFAVISKRYHELFEEKKLNELCGDIFPEKVRVLEQEFLEQLAFIDTQGCERAEIPNLMERRNALLQELQTSARALGLIANWKKNKFTDFLNRAYNDSAGKIRVTYMVLLESYQAGFESYLAKHDEMSPQQYMEQLIYDRYLEQKLLALEGQTEHGASHAFGLPERQMVVCLYGEVETLERCKEFAAMSILIDYYIDPEIERWIKHVKESGTDFDPPETYVELKTIRQITGMEQVVNLPAGKLQAYYRSRIALFKKWLEDRKEKEMRAEAVEWVREHVTNVMEAEFETWKKGNQPFLQNYEKEKKLRAGTYYSFALFLSRREVKDRELYLTSGTEWEDYVVQVTEPLGFGMKKFAKCELESFITRLQKRAENVEKNQELALCQVFRHIAEEMLGEHLNRVLSVGLKHLYLEHLTLEEDDDVRTLDEKIKKAAEISDEEKRLLTGAFAEVEELLWSEIVKKSTKYIKIKRDLKLFYDNNLQKMKTELIQNNR